MLPAKMKTRLHDWVTAAAGITALAGLGALVLRQRTAAAICASACLATILAARWSSQRTPSPMPYTLRWVLYLPRWPLSVGRLREALGVRPGERVLELGPGVGIYSLPMASTLVPGGSLEVLDIQSEMLATLRYRAERAGIGNIVTTQGDAQHLPYPDAAFDAAYVIGVLGELPDPEAALNELRRVLKPNGRLVVGEALVVDPDGVRLAPLCDMAARAGFVFERKLGLRAAYFAAFSSPSTASTPSPPA
ncbi:class I SAM-dependent methyltransferase [Pendulispora albinea]|uniref:Methyltransferase domain-containing protein n=1 Tax=Pendulispora albinea TaxID=2741071 RepID=A0ABZ2M0M1_9BACT